MGYLGMNLHDLPVSLGITTVGNTLVLSSECPPLVDQLVGEFSTQGCLDNRSVSFNDPSDLPLALDFLAGVLSRVEGIDVPESDLRLLLAKGWSIDVPEDYFLPVSLTKESNRFSMGALKLGVCSGSDYIGC